MEENKQNNSIKVIIAIAIVTVLAIGVVLVFRGGKSGAAKSVKVEALKGTPQEIINTAINNNNAKMTQEMEITNNESGYAEVINAMSKDSMKMDVGFGFNSIDGVDTLDPMVVELMEKIRVEYQVATSRKDEKFKFDLKLPIFDEEKASIVLYGDKENIGIASPILLQDTYTIPTQGFIEKLEESTLYKELGGPALTDEDKEMLNSFMEYMTYCFKVDPKEVFGEEFEKEINELTKQLISDSNITEEAEYDGYKTYLAEIDGEKVGTLMVDIIKLISEQEVYKKQIELLQKMDAGLTVDPNEIFEQMYTEVEESFKDVDVKVLYRVDDKFIRSMDIQLIEVSTDSVINIDVQMGTDKYLTDKITAVMYEGSNKDERFELEWSNSLDTDKDVLAKNLLFKSVDIPGVDVQIAYEDSYDKTKTEDNFEMGLKLSNGEETSVNIDVAGDKNIAKNKYELNLKEVDMSVEEYGTEVGMQLNMFVGINEASKVDLKYKSEGEIKNLLDLTLGDIMKIGQEIQANGMALLQKLYVF